MTHPASRPASRPDLILLVDSHHGQYVPQAFATQIDRTAVSEVSPTDWDILTQGTDDEEYWDVWQHVLDNATLRENGVTYTLHQDGDLWAVPQGMVWNDHDGAFEWPVAEGDDDEENEPDQDTEYCGGCNCRLEAGRIGLCDDCGDDTMEVTP